MSVKYVGTRYFTDEFGNTIPMDMIQKSQDFIDKKGWRRVVLSDMLEVLEQIGNKKIQVLEFLIDNMNANNEMDLSMRDIEEATGISLKTINTTIKALIKANLLKKIKRKYVLNTRIVSAFGSTEKNAMLCIQYGFNSFSNVKEETDEEKLVKLKKQVNRLELKLKKDSNTSTEEKQEEELRVA